MIRIKIIDLVFVVLQAKSAAIAESGNMEAKDDLLLKRAYYARQ